ncbi:MAG: diacylglycerol kinase family protein [Bacteroidota bacterium]
MKKFLKGFGFAFNGLKVFFKTQLNGRVHLFIAFIVIVLGFILGISRMEWVLVILTMGMVIITEMLNTGIEFVCNFISKEYHSEIKTIKDISAGAVLISAIIAVTVGFIIFIPYLLELIQNIL